MSSVRVPQSAVRQQSSIRHQPSDLLALVRQVAEEDRAAFAELHRTLAGPLAEHLRSALQPRLANAIAAATFVEVWWLSRYHTDPGTDVFAWIVAIAVRRTEEWERQQDPAQATPYAWIVAGAESYYHRVDLALTELLAA